MPCNKCNEQRFTPLTSSASPPFSSLMIQGTTVTKTVNGGNGSCMIRYRSFAMMTRWEKLPQTFLTHYHEQYEAISSSQGNTMTHRSLPLVSPSSMALSKSRATMSACTPSMTLKPTPMPCHLLQMWPNYSSSGTLKWAWHHSQNQTSLRLLDPQPCTSHTPAHRRPTSTTNQGCLSLNSSKSQGSYQGTTGSATSRGSHWCTPTLSLDSEEGWWRPPFTNMTFSPTIPNFSSHEGITASNICARSGQEKTHTPKGSSCRKKLTPSTPGKHSPHGRLHHSTRTRRDPPRQSTTLLTCT
jgi:hypothetical protein